MTLELTGKGNKPWVRSELGIKMGGMFDTHQWAGNEGRKSGRAIGLPGKIFRRPAQRLSHRDINRTEPS